jgi:dienelactone hydrolase
MTTPTLPIAADTPTATGHSTPATWQVALHAFGKGVMIAAIVVTALLGAEVSFGVPRILGALLMGFLGFAAVSLGEGLAILLWKLLGALFRGLHWSRAGHVLATIPAVPIGRIAGAFIFIAGDILWPDSFFKAIVLPVAGEIAIVLSGFAAMSLALARTSGRSRAAQVALVAVPLLLAIGFAAWVVYPGFDDYIVDAPLTAPVAVTLEDPGLPGPYPVAELAYGSGTGTRRPEFGADADLITQPVDGSAIFAGYSGLANTFFKWFWGFDFSQLPLNATVWAPEGDGPFPLVLIVHGNHAMSEYSDPGYAYLGRHLASQGYIAASVDENFLNGLMFFDGEFEEMPLRAWTLLQHLRQWREWNETPGNPFVGKVDLERIALIGHSRGGEAVAWAAHLNERAMDPVESVDDFGFGIRGIVSIAPSDAYAGPESRKPNLGDTDYLLLAGGHDADTYVLYGQQQYNRVRLENSADAFKALAYVYQANHGQFNSVWGDEDRGLYNSALLNRKPLLSSEMQQQAARALITSFLNASLNDDTAYRAVFANPADVDWLPDVVVTQFQQGDSIAIDMNSGANEISTTEVDNAEATAEGFRIATVEVLKLRDGQVSQGNKALHLAWDTGAAPTYEIALSPETVASWELTPDDALTFTLAGVPGEPATQSVVVELEGQPGEVAAPLPLRAEVPVWPTLPANLVKTGWLSGLNGFPGKIRPEEVVLQTYSLPLGAFMQPAGALDPSMVRLIRFRFDGQNAAAVYLDDIGIVRAHEGS